MQETHEYDFSVDPEPLFSTVARLLATEGFAREVAILATAKINVRQTGYGQNWGEERYLYTIYLQVPPWLYSQISTILDECGQRIIEKAQIVLRPFLSDNILENVTISPQLTPDENWREKALAWASGENVNNQGRVRSDNLPSRVQDGLLFRSQPEINLYMALKALGVSFAPLPVFVRGGDSYKRIEPDFVIVKEGIVMVVEVDGDTVHTESPSEADNRTSMLKHEGVRIERVNASECETREKANQCAKRIMKAVQDYKAAR